MKRSEGLLMGGVVLLMTGFRRLENDAVHMTQRDLTLSVRRRLARGRRLIGDTFALVLVAIAVVLIVQGAREAHNEQSDVPSV